MTVHTHTHAPITGLTGELWRLVALMACSSSSSLGEQSLKSSARF